MKLDLTQSTYFNYKEIGDVEGENVIIFIRQDIKDLILKKAGNTLLSRTFGLLMGSKIKTGNNYIIHVNEIVTLGKLKPNTNPKALSEKKWEKVQNRAYNLHPSMEIVGWYGVRKGWEAMLTQQDQSIHREHFTKSWHIIYLLDSSNGSSSFFCWHKDKLKLSKGYYEYSHKEGSQLDQNTAIGTLGIIGRALKDKMVIFTGSLALLALIGVLLSQQFQMPYSNPQDDRETAGYVNEAEGSHEEQDNVIEEYEARIANLEGELDKKQQEIEALKREIESLKTEQQTTTQTNEDQPTDGVIYIIQRGDNLYKISQKFYGTDRYSQALANINRIKDQRSLSIGSYIIIPPLEVMESHYQ